MSAADAAGDGPVLIAYDGSDLARLAIAEAGELLGAGRDALVLCVWQPFDLGFVPVDADPIDAKNAADVRAAAQRTAEAGAVLADAAGFRARALEVEASPVWKGIVDTGDAHATSLIVIGSHGRTGVAGMILGSVARSVTDHSTRTVLITHRRA